MRAGIYVYLNPNATSPAVVTQNMATGNQTGITVVCNSSGPCPATATATIANNVLVSNDTFGVFVYNVSPTIRNNTIDHTGGASGTTAGIEVYAGGATGDAAAPQVVNNIITNSAGGYGVVAFTPAAPVLVTNDLFDNSTNYYNASGPSDLHEDPMFFSPSTGDYHLSAGSPLANAATGGGFVGALPVTTVTGGGPPTGFAATVSGSTVGLSWGAVPGATGYTLHFGSRSGNYPLLLPLGTATSKTLGGLAGPMTVFFAVSATVGGVETALSSEQSVTVPAAASAVRAEDSGGLLGLSGSWTPVTNAAASGGSYFQSSAVGASVSYLFNGASVTVYRTLEPDGGLAAVTIDGQSYGNLDDYFDKTSFQAPAVFDYLTTGLHTITLSVLGQHNSASSGNVVTLDAFAAPLEAQYNITTVQTAAQQRVNAYRQLVGIGPLRLSTDLDLSAALHAVYDADNPNSASGPHVETNTSDSHFSGNSIADRLIHFGYDPYIASEVAATLGSDSQPADAVDTWISAIYHRAALLGFLYTEMGYGQAPLSNGQLQHIIDVGVRTPSAGAQAGSTAKIYTYPTAGQWDGSGIAVPTSWDGIETPNPLPPGVSGPAGGTVVATVATISGASQGNSVTVQVRSATGAVIASCAATVGTNGNVAIPTSCQVPGSTITLVLGASQTAAAATAAAVGQVPSKPASSHAAPAPAQVPARLPAQLPKTGAGGGADQWLLLILPLLVLSGGAVFARKKAGR